MEAKKEDRVMTEANPSLDKILDRLEGRILFPEKAAKLKADIEKNGLPKLPRI